VSKIWDISSGIGPCFPLTGGLCKFYANAGGKQPMLRQLLVVQYVQAASQRKLALTAKNTLFAIQNHWSA
jgi:hypothetical protein